MIAGCGISGNEGDPDEKCGADGYKDVTGLVEILGQISGFKAEYQARYDNENIVAQRQCEPNRG